MRRHVVVLVMLLVGARPVAPSPTMSSATSTASPVPHADLGLDPSQFLTQYEVKSVLAPLYRVFPATGGASPFNTKGTPEVLPCDLQNLDTQFRVTSAPGGAAVYPQATVRFYTSGGSPIVSHGYSGSSTIDHLVIALAPLEPGAAELTAATFISSVSPSRNSLFQPKELKQKTVVRMEITVMPFADPQFSQPVADPNSSNDVMNFWLMRGC
jgi:hypothetical protein